MPKIPVYEQQVPIPGPVQGRQVTPADTGAEIGAGLQTLAQGGAQLATVLQENVTRSALSDARSKMEAKRAVWTLRLQQESDAATPGDQTFAYNFTEKVSKDLAPIMEGINNPTARLYAKEASARLTADMYERAGLHQAKLAAVKATQDFGVILDSTRNTVFSDPTQFDHSIETITAQVGEANVPAITKQKLLIESKKQIALSAVQGIIKLDGQAAKDQLSAPDSKWNKYLDADNKATLVLQAEEKIRSDRVAAEHAIVMAEHALKLKREGIMDGMFTQFAKKQLTVPDIEADRTISFEQKHTLYDMIKTQTRDLREPIRTDPDVFFKTLTDVRGNQVGDVTSLAKLYVSRQVAWDDVEKLQKEWHEMATPDGKNLAKMKEEMLGAAKPQLDKTNFMRGFIDQDGGVNLMAFHNYMDAQIQAKRDAKKPIYPLFDKTSPEWLGNQVGSFKTPARISVPKFEDQVTPDATVVAPSKPASARPGAVQAPAAKPLSAPANPSGRKPGETPDAYLKRRKQEGG